MNYKSKAYLAFAIGLVCLLAASLIVGVCYSKQKSVANLTGIDHEYDDGFPIIDWEYWSSINPDVIGWITIPGTSVNYPIVQARPDNPSYYLSHDVYGNWNYYGCPYLDATCEDSGFASMNSVIYGHNIGYGSNLMFADVAKYSEYEYAIQHDEILLQSTDTKYRLRVKSSEVVAGWQQVKKTQFEEYNEYQNWLLDRQLNSLIVLEPVSLKLNTFSLVTCSYNQFNDERTIIYAQ